MTTDTQRKLLQLDRFQCEGGAGLRIESTWNRRAVFVLDAKEVAELCGEIVRQFPEHFPDIELRLSVLVSTLFDAIAHGDDAHRAWLRDAIEAHFGLAMLQGATDLRQAGRVDL